MSMSDDDEVENVSVASTTIPILYDSNDHTQEQSHPKRYVFIIPQEFTLSSSSSSGHASVSDVGSLQLITLRHPRHGEGYVCLVGQRSGDSNEEKKHVLCEVQERKHRFGDTWFIGNHVEPASSLYLATPLDVTFLAISAVRGGRLSDKYVSSRDILSNEPCLQELPKDIRDDIVRSLDNVCLKKEFGEDEVYYKFDLDTFYQWFRGKLNRVVQSPSFVALLKMLPASHQSTGVSPWTQEQLAVLQEKAFCLLSDYISSSLVDSTREACGISLISKQQQTHHEGSMIGVKASSSSADELPAAKKPRVELKSANVKRLEKAGAPKNTPTLFQMFAKKQQQQQQSQDPSEGNPEQPQHHA